MNKDYIEFRGKLYYSVFGKLAIDTGQGIVEVNNDLLGALHGEEVKIVIQRLPQKTREENSN